MRRMPVVDREGGLVGILTLDDLPSLLAEEMTELAKLVSVMRDGLNMPLRRTDGTEGTDSSPLTVPA